MNNDLISRDALKKLAIPCEIHLGALTELAVPLYQIDNAPTVESYTEAQVKELVELNKKLSEARPTGEWVEFAEFVAREVCNDDFKDESDCFAEIACRKLVKLGILKLDGDTYKFCKADMKAVRNENN